MIDTSANADNAKRYKSLSADTELHSAYEYLRNGDYKQCKRTIDKKMPKLKSAIDKVNFNIVKILLLNKTKKLKEAKKLMDTVKNEVLENPSLNSNTDLIAYFKNVLRELNEEQAASEIFKSSIKNYDLSKISRKEQFKIMKELTLNYEFQDLNAKVNAFLKNKNDPDIKFLMLMKYEILYILAFKYEKLSKNMANLTLKEMLNNYNNNNYASEKGFIDILVKYLLALGDYKTFLQLFEDKKIEFTNAPMEDIIVDIYFKIEESAKLTNFLINSIRTKLDEWNFISYQRLINYIFHWIEKSEGVNKLDINSILNYPKILENPSQLLDFYNNFKFDSHNFSTDSSSDPNSLISSLLLFFEIIHSQMANKKTNFNGYKSALLAKLLILHNLILIFPDKNLVFENTNKILLSLLIEILENSITKQSILIEVSQYFTYLNEDQRKEILSKFSYCMDSMSDKTSENYEKIIFYHKLEKMLSQDTGINSTSADNLMAKIKILEQIYFKITSNKGKLEKGERLLGDDLIILINEYFFKYVGREAQNTEAIWNLDESVVKMAYIVYSLNSLAHTASPYNYDIALFYLKISGFLNLPGKVLEILKFMNLKGPQFETVAYIAFPYFLSNFYRPGLTYMIEHFDNWDSSNKKSIRKTFWKMFTGRNFWNTEELLGFLSENENSFYKHLLTFLDLLLSFNDNLTFSYEDEEIRKENFADILDLLVNNFTKFEKLLHSNKLSMNQDMVISINKFKKVEFYNYNFQGLKINRNYNEIANYRYKIDSIYKNNFLYQNYPGYKSNFLIQNDTQVFDIYDNFSVLTQHYLGKILTSSLYQMENKNFPSNSKLIFEFLQKYMENYTNLTGTLSKNHPDLLQHYETLQKTLMEMYLDCEKSINNLSKLEENFQPIENIYTQISFIDKSAELRKSLHPTNFLSQLNYIRHFQFFKNFHLPNFTFLTSKFVDIINSNKKMIKDAGGFKMKFMNLFKTPMMNYLVENGNVCNEIIKGLTTSGADQVADFIYKTLAQFDEEILMKEVSKDFIQDSVRRIVEEQKDLLKGVMDYSKTYKHFIKDNI